MTSKKEDRKKYSLDTDGMIDVGEYLGQSMSDVLGKSGIPTHQKRGDVLSDRDIFMCDDDILLKSVWLIQDKKWGFHGIRYGTDLRDAERCLSDGCGCYHAYDYHIGTYRMVFWSQSGLKIGGEVIFDRQKKVDALYISVDYDPSQAIALAWQHMLPESLYRRLTKKDIWYLDPWELETALDEIYARRGMRFLEDYKASYFIQQPWYEGTVDEEAFTDDMLSDVELYNMGFLQEQIGRCLRKIS